MTSPKKPKTAIEKLTEERDYYKRCFEGQLLRAQRFESDMTTIRELLGIKECHGDCCTDY